MNEWLCKIKNCAVYLLQSDLLSMTIYDLAQDQDHTQLYNILLQPKVSPMAAPVQTSNPPLGECAR